MKSINFGKRLTEVRKNKKMSQDELAKMVGVHGAVIGRYERDEVKPSIEMATLIAEALEVSLDYLVGSSDLIIDTQTLKRMQEVDLLPEEDKKTVYSFLDAFINNSKLKKLNL